jgi:hypothetical protein
VIASLVLSLALAAAVQEEPSPQDQTAELVNALLGGFLGFKEMSADELEAEVAEVGGIEFRKPVPLDYLSKQGLVSYLKEVLDDEYPEVRARSDERTLEAFGAIPPGTDLRALRARLLEDNIAGFYDERPGKKRLYAVSEERKLTPANQLVLAHELRHALQDQYADVHEALPDSIGDYDDRRVALLSLLEGDATLVMERFLVRRLPGAEGQDVDLSGMSLPEASFPGVPPLVREQLVRPYIAGRDFARALYKQGGWDALKKAWSRPPDTTEQVLHPEKYLAREAALPVTISYEPPKATMLNEGALGEILIRALLGDGPKVAPAAAGWGGDVFRVWDVGGHTLLVWRSRWDSSADLNEFLEAMRDHLSNTHRSSRTSHGWANFATAGWQRGLTSSGGVAVFVASDDPGVFEAAERALR